MVSSFVRKLAASAAAAAVLSVAVAPLARTQTRSVSPFITDVMPTDWAYQALQNLVDETHAQLGNIDILVCNAAVNPFYGPSKDIPDGAFEKIMQCNVLSNHWLCHMVLPEMEARGDGSIIIVSSIGGLHASTVIGTYNISKAADFQMVRNLSAEYGPKGIRVNAIAPGLIRTDFARALWENPETLKRVTATVPLRRIGEPEELAGVAVFLASKAGSYATGQNWVVDGGSTIV